MCQEKQNWQQSWKSLLLLHFVSFSICLVVNQKGCFIVFSVGKHVIREGRISNLVKLLSSWGSNQPLCIWSQCESERSPCWSKSLWLEAGRGSKNTWKRLCSHSSCPSRSSHHHLWFWYSHCYNCVMDRWKSKWTPSLTFFHSGLVLTRSCPCCLGSC